MEETLISRGILPRGEQTLGPITPVLLRVKIKLSKWCRAQLVVFKGEETGTDDNHTNKMLWLAFVTPGQVIQFKMK